jgi:L-amino acid N-acyltransferase
MITIRPATLADLPALVEIYNQAVLHTTATMDTEPKTPDERRVWFDDHTGDPRYPLLVAEADQVVVGWATFSRWSDRLAYSGTAEDSVYVHEGYRGQGVGKMLLSRLIQIGREHGLHTIIARIASGNPASIRLHTAAGFQSIGTMREVGRKFDHWVDVEILQLIYG